MKSPLSFSVFTIPSRYQGHNLCDELKQRGTEHPWVYSMILSVGLPNLHPRSDPEIDLQVPYTSVQQSDWCKCASVDFEAGLTLRQHVWDHRPPGECLLSSFMNSSLTRRFEKTHF